MRGALLMTALAIAAVPVQAQRIDPGRQLLDELQQRQLQREEQREPGRIEGKPETKPAPAADEGICFDIDRIDLEGVTLLAADVRDPILARYTGKCLGRTEINALLAALTQAYVDRGYITTRVYVPPQNLSSRVLKLLVIEGRIEQLYMNQDADADRQRVRAAFPTEAGDKLRLQDLEQGLDQLNRVPSSSATLQLQPGKEAGGTVVAIQDRPENRFRAYVAYDTYGQERTGKQRLSLGAEADNLFSLNDTWALVYAGTLDTNAIAGNGSVGLGNWTLGLSGSYSEFLQPLTPDTELVGRSTILGLSADRLLYRSSTTRTNAVLTLDRKWFRRYVNDVSLIPQDLTVVRAGARSQVRSPDGILFLDGVLAVGTTALGATEDPANLPTDAPHAQFTKFEAGVTWLGRIDGLSLRASLRGQYSLDALYSSEQIVLGGFYTVRGYGESVAFGDSGWYSRNELGITLRPGTLVTDGFDWSPHIQPYVLLDGGQVFSKSGFFENSLGGVGVGLRLAKRPVSLDLTLAYPFIRNDLPRQEVYFRIALQI